MPTPKLSITLRNANEVIDKLQNYKNESENLEAKYQHFISEMIMLRLFSTFEKTVAEMAFKLAAGASYLNGTLPNLSVRANNMTASRGLFLNHGRSKPRQNLQWTKAKYIKESVQFVIPVTEQFIKYAQIHGASISEMRKVRNVLAHNNVKAKRDFNTVVRAIYGANIGITIGAFLTTTRRSQTSNLNRYIATTKIIIKDMAKG